MKTKNKKLKLILLYFEWILIFEIITKVAMNIHRCSFILSVFICSANIFEANASFWDSLPIISQGKSFIQFVSGDSDGARKTQDNFLRNSIFPIVPIVRSSVEAIKGDQTAARDTWRQYGGLWDQAADSIPVVGHVKGVVHYAVGDTERGHQIMKSSTRPVGVIAGGIGGAIVGGPVGAVAGGIAAGAAMDGIYTGIESAARNKYTPSGHIATVTKIVNGNATAEDYFKASQTLVGDGVAGYIAGKPFVGPKSTSPVGCGRKRRKKRLVTSAGCYYGAGLPEETILTKLNLGKLQSGTNVPVNPTAVFKSLEKFVSSPKVYQPAFGTFISPGNLPENQVGDKNDDEEEKEQRELCKNQPEIENRDKNQMANCEGKKAGEKCKVKCLQDFRPTMEEVECISNSKMHRRKKQIAGTSGPSSEAFSAEWSKEGALCEPKGCENQPEIANRDKNEMANCEGKKAGEKCEVKCLPNFYSTMKEVECISNSEKTKHRRRKQVEGTSGTSTSSAGNSDKWKLKDVSCQPKVECRNENDDLVDWFIVYRLPKQVDVSIQNPTTNNEEPEDMITPNPKRKKGKKPKGEGKNEKVEYIFMTSEAGRDSWQHGGNFYDDENNPVYNTLQTILSENNKNGYIMYNDQKSKILPKLANSGHAKQPRLKLKGETYGHAKGVFGFGKKTGIYMPHTLPQFPNLKGDRRDLYYDTSDRFGQMFMCITFTEKNKQAVLNHVKRLRPNVYSNRYYEDLLPFSNYELSLNKKKYYDEKIESKKGIEFRLFTKKTLEKGESKKEDESLDIYREILMDHYKVSMNVHTWRENEKLYSICEEGNTVYTITELELKESFTPQKKDYFWEDTQDHSKWVVSKDVENQPFFCFSDMNEQFSQTKRYGGAVCMEQKKSQNVVKAFSSLVKKAVCKDTGAAAGA